jgi:hypothetical protein
MDEVVTKPVEQSSLGVDALPEVSLSFILSFLHGFHIAGEVGKTSRAVSSACQSGVLCQHVLERDFGREDAHPLPNQPARDSVHRAPYVPPPRLSLQDFSRTEDIQNGSVVQLRSLVKALSGKSVVDISYVAAKEGYPCLLRWSGERCSRVRLAGDVPIGVSRLAGDMPASLNRLAGGMSALMVAASSNHPRSTAMASKFCDLEQVHDRFGTALHQAAYVGAAAAVSELIVARASLQARNNTYEQTPLHVACSRNHSEVVQLLLEAGASAADEDRDRLTAETIAQRMQSLDALRVVQDYMRGQPA